MELMKRKNKEASTWLDDFMGIRNKMNSIFDEPLMNMLGGRRGATALMNVDVSDDDDAYFIKADLPGIDPKEVKIEVTDHLLTIRGERKEEKEKKGKNYFRSERYFGAFERSFRLPDGVDTDKLRATCKKGVLKLTIPKTEKAKPKQISVQPEE